MTLVNLSWFLKFFWEVYMFIYYKEHIFLSNLKNTLVRKLFKEAEFGIMRRLGATEILVNEHDVKCTFVPDDHISL